MEHKLKAGKHFHLPTNRFHGPSQDDDNDFGESGTNYGPKWFPNSNDKSSRDSSPGGARENSNIQQGSGDQSTFNNWSILHFRSSNDHIVAGLPVRLQNDRELENYLTLFELSSRPQDHTELINYLTSLELFRNINESPRYLPELSYTVSRSRSTTSNPSSFDTLKVFGVIEASEGLKLAEIAERNAMVTTRYAASDDGSSSSSWSLGCLCKDAIILTSTRNVGEKDASVVQMIGQEKAFSYVKLDRIQQLLSELLFRQRGKRQLTTFSSANEFLSSDTICVPRKNNNSVRASSRSSGV